MILKLPYLRPIPKLQPLKKKCTTKAPFMRPCRAAAQQFMACSDSHQLLHGPQTASCTTSPSILICQRKGKAEITAHTRGAAYFEASAIALNKITTQDRKSTRLNSSHVRISYA